jgi:hypothetical protein
MALTLKYRDRVFMPTKETIGPYIVAQAAPSLPHLAGEKQDAVFERKKGQLVAGPFGAGYRVKLFQNKHGQHLARCHHWYNGPSGSYIL